MKLTKKTDPDRYGYSGYGIGFDARSQFSSQSEASWGKNVIIFGAGMTSSVHTDNKIKIYQFMTWRYNTKQE